ncbi:Transcription elognation factor Eaf [Macleaya cordata]|uniref:Transcription elognation factor Eaf n=1 Tax=Macleaya cordata TaxID=56857 RepID=A0A200PQC2_MACCD|nr:Transcription elognation factor Eaf [Macleaya cordata]
MAKSNKEEPNTAPQPDQWYNLTLGSSFKDHTSTKKFCTLRYEFKPASIDKNQPGSLHKNKDNRVTVEFHNNQPGKPKVSFEGSNEDYKDNDAVLFFDGHTFRLERLHRAVKRLRHVRLPGESSSASALPLSSAAATSVVGPFSMEYSPPPPGKSAKSQTPNKTLACSSVPVEVERIDIGESESPGAKPTTGRVVDDYASAPANPSTVLPDTKSDELEEHLDLVIDDIDSGRMPPNRVNPTRERGELKIGSFDINLPSQNDTDDEIADVDVSDDEADKRPNAAEALRAQVMNEEGRGGRTSSSSESSGSGSSGSGSGSGSSSSDSEASDDDSVTSI